MTTESEHTCPARAANKSTACGRPARHEHEGIRYCKAHHPPSAVAKEAERNAQWEAKWRDRQNRWAAVASASAQTDEHEDAARMAYLVGHWHSEHEGRPVREWLADRSALLRHGGLRAAIDHLRNTQTQAPAD